MDSLVFFMQPVSVSYKQYEALRTYYVEKKKAKYVAEEFGYTYMAFTSIISDFNNTKIGMKFLHLKALQNLLRCLTIKL